MEAVLGDVMALPFDDDSFDVVHAHQVFQHLADPVGALAQVRRVSRPGGLVAVRDAVYSAMCWFPRPEGMELWRRVYCATARANGGEPDAGSRLASWARAAGLPVEAATASTGGDGTLGAALIPTSRCEHVGTLRTPSLGCV